MKTIPRYEVVDYTIYLVLRDENGKEVGRTFFDACASYDVAQKLADELNTQSGRVVPATY